MCLALPDPMRLQYIPRTLIPMVVINAETVEQNFHIILQKERRIEQIALLSARLPLAQTAVIEHFVPVIHNERHNVRFRCLHPSNRKQCFEGYNGSG